LVINTRYMTCFTYFASVTDSYLTFDSSATPTLPQLLLYPELVVVTDNLKS
jgi:hypothetical protein